MGRRLTNDVSAPSRLLPLPSGTTSMDFVPRFPDYANANKDDWADTTGLGFLNNTRTLEKYHLEHGKSPYYKGMLGDIARITVHAAEYATNPFSAFIKPPIEWGEAVGSCWVDEIQSRRYDPTGKPIIDPFLTEIDKDKYGNYLREPDRVVQRPGVHSYVSTINFDREIPLGISRIMVEQYATRGEQVGDLLAAIIASANAAHMNDMFVAAKEFFCGMIRIGNFNSESDITHSPMCKVLTTGYEFIHDEEVFPNQMVATLAHITDVEFPYMKTKYNPEGRNTQCAKSTIIASKELKYPAFRKLMADTYHPDYIEYPLKNMLYIDEFPDINPLYYVAKEEIDPDDPTKTKKIKYTYKLVAMVVDDRGLSIVPKGQEAVTTTATNSQALDEYMFIHYRDIFEFLPFVNRKYIFCKKRIKDPDDPDSKP